MKTYKKLLTGIILALTLMLCFAFGASALDSKGQCGDDVYWTFSKGKLVISGTGEMWDDPGVFAQDNSIITIVINSGVTSIGDDSFRECSNLKSVTIPDSVTRIESYAFSRCENLKDVKIPDSVEYIGSYAFWFCKNIKTVRIPAGTTYVGYGAFACCENLMGITVDANNEYYTSEDGVLFNKDKTELLQYPIGNGRSSFSIPYGVTFIGTYAFEDCKNLTSVSIPYSVTDIGYGAFCGCAGLYDINIPGSVIYIRDYAFAYCERLYNVDIPNSVTYIGNSAFNGCDSFTSVTIPDSVESIERFAFSYCKKLESINVDENNEYFSSQDGVLFNKDKTELMQYPIGSRREEYTIPDGVKSIPVGAFSFCETLKRVNIPDSVMTMDINPFNSCDNLESITVVENNEYYSSQDGVLFNKDKTELIQYPNGNSRTSYAIPYGVRKICLNINFTIRELTVPVTVTDCDFYYFTSVNLTDIYYEGTEKQWKTANNSYSYSNKPLIHFSSKNYTHQKSTVITPPTCTEQGYTTYSCSCGASSVYDYVSPSHTFISSNVVVPTCENNGYTERICECGYAEKIDWKSPTGHNYGDDYICTVCGENKADNYCSCNCHKGGFSGFIWKILRIFYKLFKTNPVCACGVAHY